jgi:hypothetical protein
MHRYAHSQLHTLWFAAHQQFQFSTYCTFQHVKAPDQLVIALSHADAGCCWLLVTGAGHHIIMSDMAFDVIVLSWCRHTTPVGAAAGAAVAAAAAAAGPASAAKVDREVWYMCTSQCKKHPLPPAK